MDMASKLFTFTFTFTPYTGKVLESCKAKEPEPTPSAYTNTTLRPSVMLTRSADHLGMS